MAQQDHNDDGVRREKMQKREEESSNTKSMDTDQYQHFIPRFILRKFAQPGLTSVTVWNWWTDRHQVREIKNAFGMFNQYDFTNNANTDKRYVEKRFADLECGMGAILKKVESSPALGNDDTRTQAGLQLLESEVHTVYKFIGLSSIRNGPFGLACDPGDACSTESSQGGYREDWVKTLEFLLKTSHKELAEMDELLKAEMYRPILARYKQLARMNLFFWTTPTGEEFLLSNFLTGLEGYRYPDENTLSKTMGVPAHIFLPMSPETLLVLCSDSLCKESMLHDAPHGVTIPYNRPARGKLGKTEGPKRYQPMVPNWKTIYPITPISVDDLCSINGLILALGNVVIYKSRSTLEKAFDNIVSFEQRHKAWRTADKCSSKIEKEDEAIKEIRSVLRALFRSISKLIDRNCKDDVKDEIMDQYERVEKIMYYTTDTELNLDLLPAFCRSEAYYMGIRKAKSRE